MKVETWVWGECEKRRCSLLLCMSRRAAGMVQVEDMRRKVLFMEKEERTKAEAKEEAEREQLLKVLLLPLLTLGLSREEIGGAG